MNQIYFIRNQKVMLDKELAELYQVSTGALNQAVARNIAPNEVRASQHTVLFPPYKKNPFHRIRQS